MSHSTQLLPKRQGNISKMDCIISFSKTFNGLPCLQDKIQKVRIKS